jgi:cell wall-associated NlpC family hydrolase
MDSPLNTGPLRVVDRTPSKKIRFFAAAGAAGMVAAGVNAAAMGSARPRTEVLPVTAKMDSITAENVPLSYARPSVVTLAAPPVDDHSQAAPEPVTAPAVTSPEPAPAVVESSPAPVYVEPVKTPAPSPGSTALGDRIAAAALAQLGVTQDCTMLVTNALASVGIQHHGWPVSYFGLGYTVLAADARPGDLIYYANGGMGLAHIAVYIGGGMAVHGGWNGNSTVTFSANVGSGPVFIRIP